MCRPRKCCALSAPRHVREVELVQGMPRLGVLELPAILQKGLVADHDHMALAVEVQVLLVILAPRHRFDGALGVGDLQLQSLLDEGVDRVLGDLAVQPRNELGDKVVDVQDDPFSIDSPYALDPRDQAAFFGLQVFEQGALQGNLFKLHDLGADVVAQPWVGFLKTDDAAELEFDRVGRQYERAFTVDFLGEAAFLKQFDSLAHGAAAGLVAVHQFGFGRQPRAAFQTFGSDAGKQIAVDLVVFAHGSGCVVLKAGTLGNA